MAAELLKNQTYETLNLVDYRINAYGQDLPGDQLDAVLEKIEKADVSSSVRRCTGTIFAALYEMYWTGFTGRFPKEAYPGKNSFSSSRELRRKRGCWTPANSP